MRSVQQIRVENDRPGYESLAISVTTSTSRVLRLKRIPMSTSRPSLRTRAIWSSRSCPVRTTTRIGRRLSRMRMNGTRSRIRETFGWVKLQIAEFGLRIEFVFGNRNQHSENRIGFLLRGVPLRGPSP